MNQVIESNYVSDILSTNCSIHKRWNYIYMNVENGQQNALKCQDCIIEQQLDINNLVQIYKVIESNEKMILQNWPPLESDKKDQIHQEIESIVEQNKSLDSIQDKISVFFKEFISELVNKIEEVKDRIVAEVTDTFLIDSQMLDVYNKVSEKDQLKSILSTFQDNPSLYEQKLQNLIDDMINKKQQNTLSLLNDIRESQSKKPSFNLENPIQIKKLILNLTDQIEVYERQNVNIDFNASINHRSSEIFTLQKELDDKIKCVMNLISNKTNQCSPAFLTKMEEMLRVSKYIFKGISFDNIYEENSYPVDFSQLNSSQLKDINQIKDMILINQQKYQVQQVPLNKLSSEIQPISFQALQFLLKTLSLSTSNFEKFESQLLKYPIFDGVIEDPLQVIPLKFQIAERENKQNCCVIKNEFQNWIFQINQKGYCQSYIPFMIENNQKYVARIRCHTPQRQDYIWVGLIPEQERDSCLIYEQNVISFRFGQKNYNKIKDVVKGKPLTDIQKIEELEIHFCVNDKHFVCADFPNYENVNKLSNEYINILDTNKTYNLAFLMYHQNSRMQLTFYQAVSNFPPM